MRSVRIFRQLGVDCDLADQSMPLRHPAICVITDIPDEVADAEVVRRCQKTVVTGSDRRVFEFSELSDGADTRILAR